MATLTDSEKDRLRDIVRNSRSNPGTFFYAAWFHGDPMRKEVSRFYFVGGRTTPFKAYYSTDEFGRSIKTKSLSVYEGHHKLPDAEIVSEVIKAIEFRLPQSQ